MDQHFQLQTGISILEMTYIIASVLFILGLKMLSHPITARRGNALAAVGMGLAIIATILFHQKDGKPIGNIGYILVAIGIGTAIGWTIAKTGQNDCDASAGVVFQWDGRSSSCSYINDRISECKS